MNKEGTTRCDFDPFDLNRDGVGDGLDAFIFNEILKEDDEDEDEIFDDDEDEDYED
ncbi:MAG: hypothetical protein IJH36_06195 [Clostridia bacterium]|nr:hypothetical protein [Clostridia bacterium]